MTRNAQPQWLTIGITSVAVAAVLVGVLAIARPGTAAVATAGQQHVLQAAPATTAPRHDTVISQPAGPKSPTTAAAIVYRLTQLLPAGRTSGYAGSGSLFGQIFLDRGQGTGMLRLDISKDTRIVPPKCIASSSPDISQECRTLPNGAHVTIIRIPGNCIQSLVVDVDHGDGVGVQLNVATCLAWNGHENPPGVEALTEAEAIQIAADPSWGVTMDSALVATGAQRFPHLPTFS